MDANMFSVTTNKLNGRQIKWVFRKNKREKSKSVLFLNYITYHFVISVAFSGKELEIGSLIVQFAPLRCQAEPT
jgi:hypothetical protein